MKVKILGAISQAANGAYEAPVLIGTFLVPMELDSSYDPDSSVPQVIVGDGSEEQTWAYRGMCVQIQNIGNLSDEQILLEIKHAVIKHDKRFETLKQEVNAFENHDKAVDARRESIPRNVRLFVWQRDQGKCVQCGSTEKLEFDHIIPVAKGGSNTERNIQLLCESCNRSKSDNI